MICSQKGCGVTFDPFESPRRSIASIASMLCREHYLDRLRYAHGVRFGEQPKGYNCPACPSFDLGVSKDIAVCMKHRIAERAK